MAAIFDPYFAAAPLPELPYGSSPFRARGAVCRNDLRRMETTVEGGVKAVLAAGGDPALTRYFQQSFSPSTWYDLVPLSMLGRIAARLRNITFTQYRREAARLYAAEALGGFTGVLLRSLSHQSIAVWLPRATEWFNDFGSIETRKLEPGYVRGVRAGIPRFLVLGWSVTAVEFTEEVLRKAGALDVRAHPLAPEPDGERAGVPLFRVPFEIRWRA